MAESILVKVYIGDRERGLCTFPPESIAGLVACHECIGSGWWGYGPIEEVNGQCVVCKGTGREWVGL